MSGSPFERTTILYLVLMRARAAGTSGVADLAVRRVLPVQERVDHRILEVRAAPPGHERTGLSGPAFCVQERPGDLG
jgi:hypothetical protein